ncbi:MAG TPA: AtpZ/AtpI family protein [Bryobacteraceae bacterium]|nr:AtpZ/AtpI family protein [Bryobacteraceae bacterium]
MNDRRNWIRLTGEYLSLAFLLPSATFVGYAIGYFLDRTFGTSFLYLVFLLLGIAGGFIQLVRQIQKDSRPRRGL